MQRLWVFDPLLGLRAVEFAHMFDDEMLGWPQAMELLTGGTI